MTCDQFLHGFKGTASGRASTRRASAQQSAEAADDRAKQGVTCWVSAAVDQGM